MKWPLHGSNPQYLYEAIGKKLPEKYIDFSANINPLGPPAALKDKWPDFYHEIMVYPDPQAKVLTEKIAEKEQIPADSILIGNGGAELITLIARMLKGKKVLIVQPTFSEYEKACLMNQCEILYHSLKEPDYELNLDELRIKLQKTDAVFLCNPNNPTGRQFSTSTILSLMEECEKLDCFFILDEAFFDFLSEYDSFVPYIRRFSKFIIIRSMTKMFAIPGIRLGYLLAGPSIVAELSPLQSHWSVNALALRIGELCIQNDGFIQMTKAYLDSERKRLFEFYKNQHFWVSPSEVNFYLMKDPTQKDQFELFGYLLDQGMIPRHTYNFPGLEGRWLRFAIKSQAENSRLLEVLTRWRKLHP